MLRAASAKRKSPGPAPKAPAAPGLRARAPNAAAAPAPNPPPAADAAGANASSSKNSITWHFCEPKAAARRPAAVAAAPRPAPRPATAAQSGKQVSALLELMQRGKRKAREKEGGGPNTSGGGGAGGGGSSSDAAAPPALHSCWQRAPKPPTKRGGESSSADTAGGEEQMDSLLDDLLAEAQPAAKAPPRARSAPPPKPPSKTTASTAPAAPPMPPAPAAPPAAPAAAPAPPAAAAPAPPAAAPHHPSMRGGWVDPISARNAAAAAAAAAEPPAAAEAPPPAAEPAPAAAAEPARPTKPPPAKPPPSAKPSTTKPPLTFEAAPAAPAAVPAPALVPAPAPVPAPAAAPVPALRPPRVCRPAAPPYRPSVVSGLVVAVREEAGGVSSLQMLPDEAARPRPPPQPAQAGAGFAAAKGAAEPEVAWAAHELLHVELHDEWRLTPARVGDRLNLVGDLVGCGCGGEVHPRCARLSRGAGGMLVLRPEVLITGTALANSCTCTRRAALARQRKDYDPGKNLVMGTMKHALFERLMRAWPAEGLPAAPLEVSAAEWDAAVEETTRHNLPELLALGLDVRGVTSELNQLKPTLKGWASTFLPSKAAAAERLPSDMSPGDQHSIGARAFLASGLRPGHLQLSGVLGSEVELTSVTYGLKGTVDAVVSAHLTDATGAVTAELPLPLELKTGQRKPANMNDHNAQLLVYTLLLSDQHSLRVPAGVLFYPQLANHPPERGMFLSPAEPGLIASLLSQRNTLVAAAAPRAVPAGRMPRTIADPRVCERCPGAQHCALVHATVEGGDGRSYGLEHLYQRHVGHLSAQQLRYFRHWLELIAIEERSTEKASREMLGLSADEREGLGRAFGGLKLLAVEPPRPAAAGSRESWPHRFGRAASASATSRGRAFADAQLGPGDLVSISVEAADGAPPRWCIAQGTIGESSASAEEVVVLLQARLPELGIAERAAPSQQQQQPQPPQHQPPLLRIDKAELSTGFNVCRTNLLHLMAPAPPNADGSGGGGCSRQLELLVDLKPPRFAPTQPVLSRLPPAEVERMASLNAGQKEALGRVLSMEDYALVLGMPGTGKTSLIVHAVRALVALGKTVLITAYTHSAVDNILIKLVQAGVPLLRLGAAHRVHPLLQGHTLQAVSESVGSDEAALARELASRPVFATTSLALGQPALFRRTFDVCIVDEAGQITEPVCLGPLRLASSFVLVGDHYQLPPLVTEKAAEKAGMGTSLFKRLCEAHPRAVVRLGHQYRMAADIMAVSNTLVYAGRLACGSKAVAEATLDVPHPERLPAPRDAALRSAEAWERAGAWAGGAPAVPAAGPFARPPLGRRAAWLQAALHPSQRVVFLNTDAMPAPEMRSDGPRANVTNPSEAALASLLLRSLLAAGVPARQLALISPYRAQLKAVSTRLPASAAAVELLTVDKCQGRDFSCCVLSMVRSNGSGDVGSLLSDWRRLNVGLTRAKTKMLIIGSAATLGRSPLLSCLLELVHDSGWCLELPPQADLLYPQPTPTKADAPTADAPTAIGAPRHGGGGTSRTLAVAGDMPITAAIVQEVHGREPTILPPRGGGGGGGEGGPPGVPAW